MSITARPHLRFTVDEYDRMVEGGILTEEHRCELIRGEILAKMTIGDRHAACVNRLVMRLVPLLGGRAIVSPQNPIGLADSVPEPDLALLRPRADFYASGKPGPGDVYLVIEVGDTSVAFDRDVKGPLYAENGIPEYWLVDLEGERVEVFCRPECGVYADRRVRGRGEEIRLEGEVGFVLKVDDIL